MLTTVRGARGRRITFTLVMAAIKKLWPRGPARLDADMLSPAARRDLLLPDPPPDPRGPWY